MTENERIKKSLDNSIYLTLLAAFTFSGAVIWRVFNNPGRRSFDDLVMTTSQHFLVFVGLLTIIGLVAGFWLKKPDVLTTLLAAVFISVGPIFFICITLLVHSIKPL